MTEEQIDQLDDIVVSVKALSGRLHRAEDQNRQLRQKNLKLVACLPSGDKASLRLRCAELEAQLANSVKLCADFARSWGGAPPNPSGRRAKLADDMLKHFGVTP